MPLAPGKDISEEFPFVGISDNSCWEEEGEEEEETPGANAGSISQQAHEQDALLTWPWSSLK